MNFRDAVKESAESHMKLTKDNLRNIIQEEIRDVSSSIEDLKSFESPPQFRVLKRHERVYVMDN